MNNNIIVGTTPSITYTFKQVPVSDLTAAKLTIKRGDEILITKELAEAETGSCTLTWKLSQEDTILIGSGRAECMLNWVSTDGTRGASDKLSLAFVSNHINEVI